MIACCKGKRGRERPLEHVWFVYSWLTPDQMDTLGRHINTAINNRHEAFEASTAQHTVQLLRGQVDSVQLLEVALNR